MKAETADNGREGGNSFRSFRWECEEGERETDGEGRACEDGERERQTEREGNVRMEAFFLCEGTEKPKGRSRGRRSKALKRMVEGKRKAGEGN